MFGDDLKVSKVYQFLYLGQSTYQQQALLSSDFISYIHRHPTKKWETVLLNTGMLLDILHVPA